MKSYFPAFIAFAAVSVAITTPSVAQEYPAQSKKIGRLKDGRAYRVDPNGVRLVDQMAELEVTADDLKRQVVALEDELEERRKGCPSTGEISEENIVSAAEPQETAATCPPPERSSYCAALTAPLQLQAAALEEQVKAERARLALQCKEMLSHAEGRHRESAEHMDLLAREKSSSEERLTRRIEELERELEASRLAVKEATNQLAKRDRTAQPPQQMTARSPIQPILQAHETNTMVVQAERFKPRLTEIQQMIIQRKDLLDAARNARKGISVSIRPLTTSHGVSLDSVRAKVGTGALAEEDALAVDGALTEIETILREDIQLLKRISRL